ncbi:hypothetical protein [Actinomadura rubrisoli]|uniref:Asparagine synthase n=1 Tax=Actinomadura rubrisoli TaxID=2530368 RepID=A0A4R5ALT9_9ACTN|nr:hypothetical protein [Actinomadura rubrisoli]TDD72479.1 hypothetical protein E1298_35025 [Actinomadura rubrisoli]
MTTATAQGRTAPARMARVEIVDGEVRATRPVFAPEEFGARVEGSWPGSFELFRDRPGSGALYYRMDYGSLEWGPDLAEFAAGAERPVPSAGALLCLLQGDAPAPDSSPWPGVHRLAVGTAVRVTGQGITVTRRAPSMTARGDDLVHAVGASLDTHRTGSGYAIAYSGGMASAFLAAAALSAGHRPLLLHADIGGGGARFAPPAVPGLEMENIHVALDELLAPGPVTGAEPLPPMPDTEVPRRLMAALRAAAGDRVLVGGGLLEDLTSVKLPDVDAGARGWRLLGCEPFHVAGTLPSLAAARALLGKGVVYSPDVQPVDAPAPPSPTGASAVPGLTAEGRDAFESAHRATMALWQEHLDFLDPLLGTAVAGLAERGDGGLRLPALDPGVLAALSALPKSRLGRIRRGAFESHLPLRRELDRHGIAGVRRATQGFWLRRAAASYLHRERERIIARLERRCALADLGLVAPRAVARELRDGRDLAGRALPLLRLVWMEHWLGETS